MVIFYNHLKPVIFNRSELSVIFRMVDRMVIFDRLFLNRLFLNRLGVTGWSELPVGGLPVGFEKMSY